MDKGMKPPFEGRWNLARVCVRDVERGWKVKEDYYRCVECISWDFITDKTLQIRRIGSQLRYAGCLYNQRDKTLNIAFENCRSERTFSVKTGDKVLYLLPHDEKGEMMERWEFVPQRNTLIQQAVNVFINRNRAKPMSAYPVDLLRALRTANQRKLLPSVKGPQADSIFTFRMTDSNAGLLVFMHAYLLYERKMHTAKAEIPEGFRARKFMQFIEIFRMWLKLYDRGCVISKIRPLYVEGYDEHVATLQNRLQSLGLKFNSDTFEL